MSSTMTSGKAGGAYDFAWFLTLFYLICSSSHAMVGAEVPIEYAEPDGTIVTARVFGTESFNWMQSNDDYVIKRGKDKYWYLVETVKENKLSIGTTRYKNRNLGRSNAGLRGADMRRKMQEYRQSQSHSQSESNASSEDISSAPHGSPAGVSAAAANIPMMYILVEFNDRSATYTEMEFSDSLQDMATYFDVNSNGRTSLVPAIESSGTANNGVVGWLHLNQNHPNTGDNHGVGNRDLTRDAIVAADPFVDYAAYDSNLDGYVDADELSVVVIVAGFERAYSDVSPSVWGHKWSIFSNIPIVDGVQVGADHGGRGGYAQFGEIQGDHMATLGIMAHEVGHLSFGLPDLYDYDGSSGGIGIYGLMGSGSWGYIPGQESGSTPVMLSAWSRYKLDWIEPIQDNGSFDLTAAGHANAGIGNSVVRSSSPSATEYFLVENRRPLSYDRGLEPWLGMNFDGGILVWHIDDAVYDNSDDAHRLVDLEEADNNEASNRNADFWHTGNASFFNAASLPGSLTYDLSDSGFGLIVKSAAQDVMNVDITSSDGPTSPENDSMNTPQQVGLGQYSGTLVAATSDGTASCGSDGQPDIWFRYTAPSTGILQVSTCGTHDMNGTDNGTDTVLSIRSDDGAEEFNCNDDWNASVDPASCSSLDVSAKRDSYVEYSIQTNESVLIRVANYPGSPANDILVNTDLFVDSDGDGYRDETDNCPFSGNPDQLDNDGDGVGDACDNCLVHANGVESGQLSQRDTDGDGFGNRCDADLNNDGLVTANDFLMLRGVLNTADQHADLNGDGLVNVSDFLILRGFLNQPPGPSGLAP